MNLKLSMLEFQKSRTWVSKRKSRIVFHITSYFYLSNTSLTISFSLNALSLRNLPKRIIEGMLSPSIRDVFLRIVGRGRPSCEVLDHRFVVGGVSLVVFTARRTLSPGAGVAWERTLRSIDKVYQSVYGGQTTGAVDHGRGTIGDSPSKTTFCYQLFHF